MTLNVAQDLNLWEFHSGTLVLKLNPSSLNIQVHVGCLDSGSLIFKTLLFLAVYLNEIPFETVDIIIQLRYVKFLTFLEWIMEPNLMFNNALKIGKFSIIHKRLQYCMYMCSIKPLYKVGLITLFHKHVAWIMELKDALYSVYHTTVPVVHLPIVWCTMAFVMPDSTHWSQWQLAHSLAHLFCTLGDMIWKGAIGI